MFQHQGIWLPDGEKHFPDWMTRNGEIVDGKGTYQIKKFREAMKYVKQFRTAVDVGAHVGLWSMQMIKLFQYLEAFEPVPVFRSCWVKNMGVQQNRPRVQLHRYALGSGDADVKMAYDLADSGGTHVGPERGDVKMRTLDSMECTEVDFIKIDCEGYELEVLKGAAETIKLNRPTIIVEQKPRKLRGNYGTEGMPAVDFLTSLGYQIRREMSGDYIMTHV